LIIHLLYQKREYLHQIQPATLQFQDGHAEQQDGEELILPMAYISNKNKILKIHLTS